MDTMTERLVRLHLWLLQPRVRDERGDVPGWVLVTLMTALLVGAIYTIAQGRVKDLVSTAFQNFG